MKKQDSLKIVPYDFPQARPQTPMLSGVFKPYTGVSSTILDSGGTDKVWFYDMWADDMSFDHKCDPVEANDIPDNIQQYQTWQKKGKGFEDKKAKAFIVDKQDIADNKYDLSIKRYKAIEYEEVEYDPPAVILDQLEALETEIQADLKELRGMLQ